MKQKFAIQLHTVRKEFEQDCAGVLRELAAMGWAGVQTAQLYNHDPREIAAVLVETGLRVAGMHVDYEQLNNQLDIVISEAEMFNTRDLICPALPPRLRNEQGFREARSVLNEIAHKGKEKGLRIHYHNHAYEFETLIDGGSALSYMCDTTDGSDIYAEPDVYWVKKSGIDPLYFIQQYPNRIPYIHLKDMTPGDNSEFTEIGTGIIDFKPILIWGEKHGIEWYVVEQDQCKGSAMDSVAVSYTQLVRLSRD
ncbi:sugar phosphate isomerase/epimerase family protein [Paenibacillus sp. Soil750]|uniref:sugar phosphate isomerase/epimerase family protein n=1 Tax=Paenibacillus sp. Soil750 TaxID=1736398 RepID=UPI0006F364FC|nr:sugar phosphate isomerase/epimerase [Paenibacillus sp. Soil750]KRE55943.1 xylose isomerase [Paenibacillus sp. Soil750]